MKIEKTGINGLVVISPEVYHDQRGYFYESYNNQITDYLGHDFCQDNESKSKKGVLRGMHFQENNPQAKLVRVSSGTVYDVVVDLRKESDTYLKWFGIYLSDENKKMLYVPKRFAHGFLVVSDEAIFNYKCSTKYDPDSQSGFMYDDKTINIKWPEMQYIISEKDMSHEKIKWRYL